jgi:hypothetical protein
MSRGSFRSRPIRWAEDQAVLTGHGLAEGESIRYWTRLPHGAASRIVTAASHLVVDPRTGRVVEASYDAGAAARARLREGIVDWTIRDEAGQLVPWDSRQADELLDGLPLETVAALGNLIGSGEPPDLSAPADPEHPDGETLGEEPSGS